MARVELVPTIPDPISAGGTILSVTSGTIMVPGADNGFIITPKANDVFIVDNVVGGAAVLTLISPLNLGIEALGAVITDAIINMATTDIHVINFPDSLKQADGTILVDCDVAIEILQLRMSAQQ